MGRSAQRNSVWEVGVEGVEGVRKLLSHSPYLALPISSLAMPELYLLEQTSNSQVEPFPEVRQNGIELNFTEFLGPS